MQTAMKQNSPFDLDAAGQVHWNLTVPELVEAAIRNGEATLASNGALVARTGKYTGRTPKDKVVVREPGSEANVWWDNNGEISPETFAHLKARAQKELAGRNLYVVDTYGGADPTHRIKTRFIVEKAWHALFIRNLLIRPSMQELADYEPDWTVLDLGTVELDPATDHTRSEASISLNFAEKTVMVFGTQYAGEMKKSVFTIMNYLLPLKGVLSMHCSANVGPDGSTALFFGLSGTGKTTLSADHDRQLIGDDEHGWSDTGIFNIEGGCYAKCIGLKEETEPEIYHAIRFGSVLENVVLDDRRIPDYKDNKYTENTRCAYPLEFIPGAVQPSVGGHPSQIVFLTCDASGVLPPISKLTPDQAMFYFLNGYTAKVAGTEAGVKDPELTFSTCFGAPFLPLRPKVYAELLKEKMAKHNVKVWLVNTGWTGGPFGVGHRMSLPHTRALIRAAFAGELDSVAYAVHPVFGLSIPQSCPGVPAEVLNPRDTWADKEAYDSAAASLNEKFQANFQKFV